MALILENMIHAIGRVRGNVLAGGSSGVTSVASLPGQGYYTIVVTTPIAASNVIFLTTVYNSARIVQYIVVNTTTFTVLTWDPLSSDFSDADFDFLIMRV